MPSARHPRGGMYGSQVVVFLIFYYKLLLMFVNAAVWFVIHLTVTNFTANLYDHVHLSMTSAVPHSSIQSSTSFSIYNYSFFIHSVALLYWFHQCCHIVKVYPTSPEHYFTSNAKCVFNLHTYCISTYCLMLHFCLLYVYVHSLMSIMLTLHHLSVCSLQDDESTEADYSPLGLIRTSLSNKERSWHG